MTTNDQAPVPVKAPFMMIARLAELLAEAQYALYDANRALNAHSPSTKIYAQERRNLDLAVLFVSKGKWYAGRYNGASLYLAPHTKATSDAKLAEECLASAIEIAKESEAVLTSSDNERPNRAADRYRSTVRVGKKGAEIEFVDDVPLVPTICPIVVLRGSSYEMGRQYAEQVLDIFGDWIFRQIEERRFQADEIAIIEKWRAELEKHAPEILEMARGWVDGAARRGIQLDYLNIVQLWTGHFEPHRVGIRGHGVRDLANAGASETEEQADASYFGGQTTVVDLDGASADLCSGACAWGEATRDGALVAGATTDHDCTFQATIVAFPDNGAAFIYTPFSVIGFIPGLGQYYFAGHPGMNNKGLAYIHHGGGLHGIEAAEDRGYGLRRGASVFHNLRFANSAKEALRNELSWPIGDVGTVLGSVGGFYADASYGYVCEARPSLGVGRDPIVREWSFDETGSSYQFLYANNNSLHPRSSAGFGSPQSGYQFNSVEGWIQDRPASVAALGEVRFASALSTKSSQGRNRYLFDSMQKIYGSIDLDEMARIYSTSAPERYRSDGQRMSHKERETAWLGGVPWPSSICHRVNAFTATMKPDNGDQGIYMGCIGPANRRALMHISGHGYYYYDEANEFWEIQLCNTPDELLNNAKQTAARLLREAEDALKGARTKRSQLAVSDYFEEVFARARDAFASGEEAEKAVSLTDDKDASGAISRALRQFTTCQVRAKQMMTDLTRNLSSSSQ
ncbi:hypothetical protein OZ411_15070 [Bradyrhizobium sp. Arg237L]|uniref:hypothetical protein n=1 Tax=Bradyrhizobium sp. Arg237L TaxID=3003352 RepID=UPI00249EF014|nr:hypothetical protein [Bradyrhizobium sp. Arg237L]MDI4234134.1 hypothetical protein [Bradyrhizobium sp. Arg237L]